MKKFLVILMVLAMASVLFVGCTTPPTPDPDPDPTPTPVVVISATPVLTAVETSAAVSIFDVTSTSTLYMNKAEVGTSILVKGTAPSESLVQLYLGDVAITPAVGEAAATGLWSIAVAKSSLGVDGVKVLTAKCTEVGLAVSEASNVVTFTYDTDLPGISAVAATAASTEVAADLALTVVTNASVTAIAETETLIPAQTIVAGTWIIKILGTTGITNNVLVVSPSGTGTYYTVTTGAVVRDTMIPGIKITFTALTTGLVDATVKIVVTTAAVSDIAARATITFDEDLGYSGMAAGTYSFGTTTTDPSVYKDSTYVAYWTTCAPGAVNATCNFSVYGITDLAGNVGGTLAAPLTKSCTVGAASATALKP